MHVVYKYEYNFCDISIVLEYLGGPFFSLYIINLSTKIYLVKVLFNLLKSWDYISYCQYNWFDLSDIIIYEVLWFKGWNI